MPISKCGLYALCAAILLALVLAGADGVGAQGVGYGRYDRDSDGLIEIGNLEQLNAVRWDLDGDGVVDSVRYADAYNAAFPGAGDRMSCPRYGCVGYELAHSLDFESAASYAAGEVSSAWTTGGGWLPIGYHGRVFSGVFEGNGFAVANLFIDYSEYHGKPDADFAPEIAGLFGFSRGDIRRVGVVDADVVGGNGVGGLVGYALVGGMVADSYVSGKVAGAADVGGLVGWNQGRVVGSYAVGNVLGDANVGGLVGWNEGSVVGSYATGNVSGEVKVGGLVGSNYGGAVGGSYAVGNVTGGSEVGGLVGYSGWGGSVMGSYANGDVSGEVRVGGLVGDSDGESSVIGSYASGNVAGLDVVGGLVGRSSSGIVGSYASGGASGARNVGGLVGLNGGRVANSYATGRALGVEFVGGFAGYSEGGIVASYWDVGTSGQSGGVGRGTGDGVVGKSTAELQAPTGYGGIYAGWGVDIGSADDDFNAGTGEDDIWDFGSASQYPVLKADMDGDGVATWGEFGNQERDEVEQALTPLPTSTSTPMATNTVMPLPTSTPTAISAATPLPTITPAPSTQTPTLSPASISMLIPTRVNTATRLSTATPAPPTQTPVVVAVVATSTPSGNVAAAGGCNSAGIGAANLVVMLVPLAVITGARWRRKL